jgi:hypothetical protein
MLTQPLLHQLHELRLRGMAAALEQQLANPAIHDLGFDERMALLIQHELVERQSCRLASACAGPSSPRPPLSKIWTSRRRAASIAPRSARSPISAGSPST